MQSTHTQKIWIAIIIIIVLIGGYALIRRHTSNSIQPGQTATTTSTNTSSSTSVSLGDLGTVQGSEGYTITQVPIDEGKGVPQPIPSLTRATVFGTDPSLTPDIKKAISDKITSTQTALSKNPGSLENWIYLGVYQKMAGDYAGSVISWQYASKLAPKDSVSLGNLGNLYAYYLHDTTLGVSYYNKAIQLSPTQSYLYTQLADVYKDILKDVATARNVIDRGLTAIPNDQALMEYKANLK